MSLIYPFCDVSDIESLIRQNHPETDNKAFGASTTPTLTEVKKWLDQITSSLRSACSTAGYDLDNLHETGETITDTLDAGDDKEITSVDGTVYNAGETLKIEGLDTSVRKWEFVTLKSISTNTLTIATVANSYDGASYSLCVVNEALSILRDLCIYGVAARIEEALLVGISEDENKHVQGLWKKFYGSKETQSGIWGIKNIEEYLLGATRTTEAFEDAFPQSYGSEHVSDSDLDPTIKIDDKF